MNRLTIKFERNKVEVFYIAMMNITSLSIIPYLRGIRTVYVIAFIIQYTSFVMDHK